MNITPPGMSRLTALAFIGIFGFGAPRGSEAQTPPPAAAPDTPSSHSNAQSEAGEPRATTSPDAQPAPEQAPGAAPATAPRAEDASRSGRRSGPKADEVRGKAQGSGKSTATDKLQLQTATVTGDQEQPKVMYIVPWKKSDIGDLSGKPMNSLLDEALAPVDRDEFKREVVYYQAVRADASHNGAAGGAANAPTPPR
jgi:hypothetical protein